MLAICGQVPTEEIGTSFFQEVDNDALFSDVAVFTATVTSANQMPQLLEAAVAHQGVAVLNLPGDISGLKLPHGTRTPRFAPPPLPSSPAADSLDGAAAALRDAEKVTLLVGRGAREAREEVLALAEKLAAPTVLTLKAKEGLEHEDPYEVGQSGLIGNPAAVGAMDECDVLFMIGTDFPYREWYPEGKKVIQLDTRTQHIGRRTPVDIALVGGAREGLRALLPMLEPASGREHLEKAQSKYAEWMDDQRKLADPSFDESLLGKVRSLGDNPEEKVRPEAVALALDEVCPTNTIFTSDTGMSTVWLSRLLPMRGERRLIGSYNPGLDGERHADGARRAGARSSSPRRRTVR